MCTSRWIITRGNHEGSPMWSSKTNAMLATRSKNWMAPDYGAKPSTLNGPNRTGKHRKKCVSKPADGSLEATAVGEGEGLRAAGALGTRGDTEAIEIGGWRPTAAEAERGTTGRHRAATTAQGVASALRAEGAVIAMARIRALRRGTEVGGDEADAADRHRAHLRIPAVIPTTGGPPNRRMECP